MAGARAHPDPSAALSSGQRRPSVFMQRGLDALVIADHVVAADLLDGRCVEAADDRDSLARRRDDERARPGAVRPRDQVETRVAREHRLANESEPDVRRPARARCRSPARASPGRGSTPRHGLLTLPATILSARRRPPVRNSPGSAP